MKFYKYKELNIPLIYKNTKYIRLSYKKDIGYFLSCNRITNYKHIDLFIDNNYNNIKNLLYKYNYYKNNLIITINNIKYFIKIIHSNKNHIEFENNFLILYSKSNDLEYNKNILKKFLSNEFKKRFELLFYNFFNELKDNISFNFLSDYQEIRILYNYSYRQLGVYNRLENYFKFSYILHKLSDYYLKFVIAHEICHLKEFNHKSNFHSLLELIYNKHRVVDKELNNLISELKLEFI